mgnify:CR=1 FL=1
MGFKDSSEYKVKEINGIQEGFSISEDNIKLSNWMAKRYFCNISDANSPFFLLYKYIK